MTIYGPFLCTSCWHDVIFVCEGRKMESECEMRGWRAKLSVGAAMSRGQDR